MIAKPVETVAQNRGFGYTKLDMEASYPFMKHFTLRAFARNVLDVDYQERFGYPAAGANYGVTLTAKF